MTLEEAILHAREVAREKQLESGECTCVQDWAEAEACYECSKEHEQLADWLEELKKLRIVISKATELCCKCSDSSECPMLYPFLKEGTENEIH